MLAAILLVKGRVLPLNGLIELTVKNSISELQAKRGVIVQ
jgi:hypothetical protein